MNFATIWKERCTPAIEFCSNLSLLVLRIWLAQEFLYAAYHKLGGGFSPPQWFVGLDFPVPFSLLPAGFNWVLVGVTELLCGLAIVLGLWSRLSALVLLIVTYVAVYAVHFDLSWAGWNQIEADDGLGFKVPLMIGVMLFVIFSQGAGRWSLDNWAQSFKRPTRV